LDSGTSHLKVASATWAKAVQNKDRLLLITASPNLSLYSNILESAGEGWRTDDRETSDKLNWIK
jgi:hypothetical protein